MKNPRASRALKWALDPGNLGFIFFAQLCCTLLSKMSKIFLGPLLSQSLDSPLVAIFTQGELGLKQKLLDLFGSFGLSTKEPYTIMLCLLSLALLALHHLCTPPSAIGLDIELHIWYNFVHIYPIMLIKYLVILTHSF